MYLSKSSNLIWDNKMRWNGKYGTKGTKWEQNTVGRKLMNKYETVKNLMVWQFSYRHKRKALENCRKTKDKIPKRGRQFKLSLGWSRKNIIDVPKEKNLIPKKSWPENIYEDIIEEKFLRCKPNCQKAKEYAKCWRW